MATEQVDAVIIGSGAGGAPIAHRLARAGRSVLVLEKGPWLRPQYQEATGLSGFKRDEMFSSGAEKRVRVAGMANWGESYYASHVEPDLNDEPHVYPGTDGRDRATIEGYTAQVVGGGTQLYGGVSLRFTPTDLRLQSFNAGRGPLPGDPANDVAREARDWPVTYEQLEPYYTEAERLVGINGSRQGQIKPASADHYQTPAPANPISDLMAAGLDALGMPRYRTPLAVITEDHEPSGRRAAADSRSAFVNRYGDPLGLKSNTWVALLAPVMDLPNIELRANCVVTHLELDGPGGSTVRTVHYRDAGGVARTVAGTIVVVACSAIESVRLLQLSGEADPRFLDRVNHNGLLGRYFLTHCFGGGQIETPQRYDKSISLDSDWATDWCGREELLHERGLWAGAVIYNNTSDEALPLAVGRTHGNSDLDTVWRGFLSRTTLVGDALVAFLWENVGRSLSVTYMANQVPQRDNRIELHPTVRDKWGRRVAYVIKRWHDHDKHVSDTLAGVCADILHAAVPGGEGLTFGSAARDEQSPARMANHILGGARFGTDRADSVLDPTCRVWDVDNLYVTDGSFMPTSGGANPTLTIQANALRVADHLLTRF
jgi:choline dehydrogenase-like flavoprotein